MKRSTDRILTTHTGSLPRPVDLTALLVAHETGEPYDHQALPLQIRAAVADVVAKQCDTGLDVINDGEMSKFFYATYIKDRLTGFDGESLTRPIADARDFPDYAQRTNPSSRSIRRTPACTGPITYQGAEAVARDIANFTAALRDVRPQETFLTAASPGVIALFLQNQYYPSDEAYLYAIAEAMKPEYTAIYQAGFLLQVDCPDLAMGRHFQFADASLDVFLRQAAMNVEVLNYALADIPPERLRLHLCWGNYEGPHHWDVPLQDIIRIVFGARPMALSFEAANPRHAHEWKVFQEVALPEGKLLMPGVVDSTTNYIEHPELVAERIVRFAQLVGRENVIAGVDCGLSTSAVSTKVDPAIAWAKLQSLVEGARLASKQLWA
jgi:5-methyltetrahydropteroyltriglutamate--homocysteine methyltransferase